MNYLIKKVGWCLICDQGWVEIYKDKNIKNFLYVVMNVNLGGNIQTKLETLILLPLFLIRR